jgi:hypothetical protein
MSIFQRFKASLSLETLAAALAIGFGLVLRLRQYTLNLSLWLDEAMLSLNLVHRSFGELLHPLDYDQGAPLGFLWLVKAAVTLLGNRELTLRLLPFLAGCLALPVLWRVARQLVKPVGVTFALLVLASSRYLVSYGAQVKQYAVDVTVTLLLYWLGLFLFRKQVSNRDYFLLAALGGLSIWVSHPAVFTLGGLGLALILTAVLKKDWQGVLGFGLASFFWTLNFAALYWIQYRALASNGYLTGYWAEYFLPLNASAPGWTLDHLSGLFSNPGGLAVEVPAVLILGLFLAGVASLFGRGQRWVWAFVLSLGFTLAASSLGKYPFGGRMGMFAVPGLLICAGEGLEVIRRVFARPDWQFFSRQPLLGLAVTLTLAGYLVLFPVRFAVELALQPKMSENIAPTLAYLKTNYREGDLIYLYHWSLPAFRYYAPKYGLEAAQVVIGSDFQGSPEKYCPELTQQAAGHRTWLLFSHLTDYSYLDEREALLACAGRLGSQKREFSEPGTSVNLYLYDLTGR